MSLIETRLDSFIVDEIFAPGCKSVKNLEEVNIRFVNNSSDTVDLCWIDFRGNLVRYLKLGSREKVKLTTFIGHCWIARFIRNGAPAQFLPDRTEVFVITRRFPHTAVVFIIQKGFPFPVMFQVAFQKKMELFHEQQRALCSLPVPEFVKFDIYFYIRRKRIYQTALFLVPFPRSPVHRNQDIDARVHNEEEICNILKDANNTFPEQLLKIFANGQIDLCLQVVSDLSVECPDFEINEVFLTCIKKELVIMSSSTVHTYAKKWIDFLSQNTSGIRNHCLLLKQLICCTNLLQNKQLQLLLQEILPQTYHHLCFTKQYSMASVIAEIICYSITLPAAYSDDCDREVLRNVWDKLLLAKERVKSAHFDLCTVLVMSSLNFDCTQHMQYLEKSLNVRNESDDLSFSSRKQLHLLIRSVFRHSGLIDIYATKVLEPFFRCLLINLSLLIDENFPQQKGNVALWIRKTVMEILSTSNKNCEDNLKSWKMMMSAFVPASHHILLSDKKLDQIMQLICGKGFSLKTVPISLRVTLFCVLISLIPCIPSEVFDTAVESTLSIMRSDAKLFRSLINSYEEKTLKKFIKILLRCGYSNNSSKSTQILVKEFLFSNCSHDALAVKCDSILKAAAKKGLIEEQYYFLKPLCDALGEIHYETNAGENSSLRISTEKIFRHIYGLISPLDSKDAMKMILFELSLSILPVVKILHDNNTTATEKEIENVAEHVKIADQLCRTLCKHPDRVVECGIVSEQLSQLLRRSFLWMVKRGKLEHIVSWKYVRYFDLYDKTTIDDIINIASVEMLKSLLHSSSPDLRASEKFALYFALSKHQNEEKRKLLSAVLKDILKVVVDIAETDYLAAICFLRHILPVAVGNAYERDFVSFALTILAVNCESLSANFVALRSAVSLLLDCLQFGAQSVTNDQCSFYISLLVCVRRATQKYINSASAVDPQFIRHLSYGFAKIANEMVKYERSFSRVAPFVISECLEDAEYLSFALFRIFSMPTLDIFEFDNRLNFDSNGRKISHSVQCKYPEVLIRLERNENHSVPVCPPVISGRNAKSKLKQSLQNVITCDGLICNRCRCDVKMGYQLSNNTAQAKCVLICPTI
uniref:VHL domain-containing protein n=1 Tax=Elaeophora elaphi TaxID=1147741 RepID=A0A158Q8S3_9BILA